MPTAIGAAHPVPHQQGGIYGAYAPPLEDLIQRVKETASLGNETNRFANLNADVKGETKTQLQHLKDLLHSYKSLCTCEGNSGIRLALNLQQAAETSRYGRVPLSDPFMEEVRGLRDLCEQANQSAAQTAHLIDNYLGEIAAMQEDLNGSPSMFSGLRSVAGTVARVAAVAFLGFVGATYMGKI